MITITFVSHYNKQEMNIRLSDDKAKKTEGFFELYLYDLYRIANGYEPETFSRGQIKRLDKALPGIDYWDKVVEA